MKLYSILLLSFFALGAKVVDRIVATVNDEAILESDVTTFMRKLKSKSFQELFGGIDERAVKDRETALQLLIDEKIINQQVKKLDLQVTDQEVDGKVREISRRNGITPAQLAERLKQLGTPMADYREGISRQIERKNLMEREIRPNMEVTEEQLRHFYMRNKGSGAVETEYKIAHILIENKARGGISGAERARRVAEEAAANPGNFENLVKEYSDDTGTAGTGGLLGYYSVSQLAKEFREAVPKTPVWKVTAPIKTAAGYHIIKVLETRSASDFASLPKDRKEMLRNQIIGEEVEKRMTLWLERKKQEAHVRRFTEKS